MSLSWDDPGDSSITGYQVLRRNPAADARGVFHTVVDDTGSSGTSYLDTTVAAENRYFYRVRARNAAGLSPMSAFFRADVPAPDPTPENSAASGSPTITGTAQVHETLSADTAGIADANGLNNVEYAYRWVRSTGGVDTDIGAATGSTYPLVRGDLGHTVRVRVSFNDDDGYSEILTSAATGPVVRPPNASPSGRPAVSGVLAVGKTLTADTSGITDPNGLSNPAFTYQWVRSIDSTDTDIAGATGSTYPLASSDEGAAFKVTVAFTDDDGYAETLTSDPTEVLETEGQDGQDNGVQPRVAPTSSPQNLRASGVAYASLTLEWDAPDTGITHIRIVRTGGNLPTDTLVALRGSRHNRAYAQLEPDTGYTFTVEFGASTTEFGTGGHHQRPHPAHPGPDQRQGYLSSDVGSRHSGQIRMGQPGRDPLPGKLGRRLRRDPAD